MGILQSVIALSVLIWLSPAVQAACREPIKDPDATWQLSTPADSETQDRQWISPTTPPGRR
ncbi:MAG TPA: hypothetical protein PKV86_03495, partial [Syntrophobacteraceae bacterium]|nr:hypothetical protein [Syntrophobacteraceae bacterium]